MVRILYGNEPFLINAFIDNLKSSIDSEMNYSSVELFDSSTVELLRSYPFMSDTRLVTLNITNLKDIDTPLFREYLNNQVEFSNLVIVADDVDLRTKFAKELNSLGVLVEFSKVGEQQLINIIAHQLNENACTMEKAALKEFIEREHYFDNEEVDLYLLVNDLRGLCLIDSNVTLKMVIENIKSREVDNAFSLAKNILSKNSTEIRHQCNLISDKDVIKVMCLLLREYRLAYKAAYYDSKSIGTNFITLKEIGKDRALQCILLINEYIVKVKSSIIEPHLGLLMLTNTLQMM